MNNTQRLEEFRKKLREGRPVRVRNGQVVLEDHDERNSAAPPEPAVRAVTPEGVQVKPHDWGAGADASAPFYQRPDGEVRALKEQALLAREYRTRASRWTSMTTARPAFTGGSGPATRSATPTTSSS